MYYIASGVNFCRENVCANFYSRELYFGGSWKNTQKNSCHTVSQEAVCEDQLRSMYKVRQRGTDGLVICEHVLANHFIGR